jgi:hypothetical protein
MSGEGYTKRNVINQAGHLVETRARLKLFMQHGSRKQVRGKRSDNRKRVDIKCPQIFAKKTNNRKNVFRVARSMYGQDSMNAIMFLKKK